MISTLPHLYAATTMIPCSGPPAAVCRSEPAPIQERRMVCSVEAIPRFPPPPATGIPAIRLRQRFSDINNIFLMNEDDTPGAEWENLS